MIWRVLRVATISLWRILLLAKGNLELANAPANPCYHHTDALYDCSISCLTHFVSAQVNKLQHAVPVKQGYIKLHLTMEKNTQPQSDQDYQDSAIRTLKLQTSKRGRPNAPHCLSSAEVARETSTPLFPNNWASYLLAGGMLGSQNRKKESKMAVAK